MAQCISSRAITESLLGNSIAGVSTMLFQDKTGKLLTPDQVDELSAWEIEDKEIHVAEE